MENFIGEIKIFGGTYAPAGWANCEGQLLQISQFDALFSLIGTIYGGDGVTTFGLPNLSGRVPIHQGAGPGLSNRVLGQSGGTEQVTLTPGQLANHNHPLVGTTTVGTQSDPTNHILAQSPGVSLYLQESPSGALAANAIQPAGSSQPHENRQPYQAIRYIIALYGIYPSPS